MRSKISLKLIFASCVWYSDRAYHRLCVLIEDIGWRLPLELQCSSYQGQRGDVRSNITSQRRNNAWTRSYQWCEHAAHGSAKAKHVSNRHLHWRSTVKSSSAKIAARVASCEGCCNRQFFRQFYSLKPQKGCNPKSSEWRYSCFVIWHFLCLGHGGVGLSIFMKTKTNVCLRGV